LRDVSILFRREGPRAGDIKIDGAGDSTTRAHLAECARWGTRKGLRSCTPSRTKAARDGDPAFSRRPGKDRRDDLSYKGKALRSPLRERPEGPRLKTVGAPWATSTAPQSSGLLNPRSCGWRLRGSDSRPSGTTATSWRAHRYSNRPDYD